MTASTSSGVLPVMTMAPMSGRGPVRQIGGSGGQRLDLATTEERVREGLPDGERESRPGDPLPLPMGDDVEGTSKIGEAHAVAVAEHHLPPVPEGVVEFRAPVDVAVQTHPVAVDRVAVEHLLVEVPRRPESVEGSVDGVVPTEGGRWTEF